MSDTENRTPESHPLERSSDSGRFREWWGAGRGYRDLWLLGITFLVLMAVVGNSNQTDDIQESRVVQTRAGCLKANETIASSNEAWTTLQRLIVAGVAAPGDKPVPAGEKDPFKWTDVREGEFSRQIRESIPSYPPSADRLKRAKVQAAALEGNKIKSRNCEAEVEAVRNAVA